MEDLILWLTSGSIVVAILGSCCATILPLAIVGGLGYFFYSRYRQGQTKRDESQTWPTARGVVLFSRVEVHGSGDSTRVVPMVVYQYEVGGQTYQGKVKVTNANAIEIGGCVMGGVICQSKTWTKVD